ncbi:HEAT repeat-containing protein 1 homolog [Drosophila tropicalis]|uniref:HEAT repeat-containing protein 1 homolog n=1 Tax=Drosophila tropicalis TaxID=46794 RepID=UPI0035ABCD23
MSTSLAQQLQKLAAPQTAGTLADAHSRASILFDPKEAATKDRRAIYEIGLTGLQDLTEFNPAFKEFQLTLYDEATLTLERSVELPEVNKMLDAAIAKFLRLLSPYILLRPAHMAFEWLLRRFQVHEYNRDDVMALILPYHETKIFIQVLQTMRLRQSDNNWSWLRPLQRPGVTLAKSAIINRAATNPAFLGFICKSTRKAVKELGPRAHQLQTQINFYSTVVVGALQAAKSVEDWHITTILEPLLKGLASETVDFMAAAYVIVAQLVSRTKLKSKVCNALLERIANCPFERLHTTSLLLLIWINDKQKSAKPEFKSETILNLVRQKWLIICLASLAKDNIAIQPICIPLIRGSVAAIREKDEDSSLTFKQFLDSLIGDVPFSKAGAQQLINCFLDTYVETEIANATPSIETASNSNEDDEDTIVIDSDDEEMPQEKTNFQAWYSAFMEKLERRFPEAFDLSVKEALRATSKTSNREKALKLALGFRLNTTDEKAKLAYEKLYHYSADWRLKGVKQLLRNLKIPSKRERSLSLLEECLSDRLQDDSGDIVAALLTLDTNELIGMLKSPATFAQILCRLLQRAQVETQDWIAVIPKAVQHLTTADVSDHYDKNLVLLALMPLLFPSDEFKKQHHQALVVLLESEFVLNRVPFLKPLKVEREFNDFNLVAHRQNFLDVIASSSGEAVNLDKGLLESVEQHGGVNYLKEASQFTHLLLLLTAYAKRQLKPEESLQMLEKINQYSKRFSFKWAAKHKTPHVKLQLFLDFLLTLASNTNWSSKKLATQSWTEQTADLKLCLLLIEILAGHVYSENLHSDHNDLREWSNALMQCLNCIFQKPQQKLNFLSNFFIYERLPQVWPKDADYAIIRLQGFCLLQAVVRGRDPTLNCTLTHVLRVANACASPLRTLRLLALDSLKLMKHIIKEKHVIHLVEQLLQRTSELGIDQDQYALILYTILVSRLTSTETLAQDKLNKAKLRRCVIELATDEKQVPVFTIALLSALKHVNNEELLTSLLPLGVSALEKISSGDSVNQSQLKQLPWPYSQIYRSVVERFEGSIALKVLSNQPLAWDLFTKSFEHQDSYIQLEQKLQPIPCLLLNTLTPETFEKLQSKHKVDLIKLLVDAATKSDNDSIFLAGHRLLKRCNLECQPLVAMLLEMATKGQRQTETKTTKRRVTGTSQLDLTSTAWKQGMTLLELLEHKKQLKGAELLIPPLFELLQACLSLEEHSAAEYPKQLILSSLLHSCQTAEAAGIQLAKALPESCFRIEQVVQCLRNTQNPQTQQQALLFLTHCAGLYPQQVLHKIVEIFTFVGSSVARHDDAFSLHIIHNVVESIVPILLTKAGQREQLVIPVLKVFSDICTDVPVHRRLPLYATLFRVLEPKEHLWQFLCIVFESQVLMEEKISTDKSRLEFARELTMMFENSSVILETFIKLLDYLSKLPVHIGKTQSGASKGVVSYLSTEHQLFDVRTRTFKQLRHYKYLIMDHLSTLSSSQEFQTKMSTVSKPSELLPHYQDLILKTLAYVTVVNDAMLGAAGTPSLEKYWRVLANHVHDVLDNAIGLLSPQYFISVITELLQHDLIYVRIKVLELLVQKLNSTSNYFEACEVSHFGVLFSPLDAIVNGILESEGSSTAQQAQLQQTALQALQLLAHRYGRTYLEECRTLLATLTRITKRRSNVPKAVVGNVVLTLVEICAALKAHALAQLPKFAPQLVELLKDQVQQMNTLKQGPDYLCSTLVTAFHKLFNALPLFLGPYLVDIISGLVRLSVQLENSDLERDKRAQALKLRMKDVWTALVNGVEVRILVPSCAKSYGCLMEAQAYDELGHLMQHLLLQCIKINTNAQLEPVRDILSELFLHALEFRLQVRGRSLARPQLSAIEANIGETFVTWILKLSETSFRPMYSKLHKWALEKNQQETRLTYFLLTQRIAEALKSLFVLFASESVEESSKLVHEHNSLRTQFVANQVEDNVELLKAVLTTLHHVFLHCNDDFVNDYRFNALMQPLVDQLENELVLESEPLQQSLIDCIAQLAVATNDVMWKQLNAQVLLKTRTQTPEVRILSFNTCVAIARKLGDSFAPLLPETVPFIAELLEDEHERVEKSTRSAVQELETILGEPVQKYL